MSIQSKSIPKADNWRMFDRIAARYDLLNRLLSLRCDVAWRKRLARHLPERDGLAILDVATGTADVLLTLCRNGQVSRAVGVDMAVDMLNIGRRKIAERHLSDRIALLPGNALHLPVQDNRFDAVTIAFGIRNIPKPEYALGEMRRILKPGGRALILEFSLPGNQWIKKMYLFYFRHVLPRIGGMLSGDKAAYSYLNKTVEDFPYGDKFTAMLVKAGFVQVRYYPLTFGIATIYCADKTGYNPITRTD
ncbi:MAG TPA: bifunctional demethylmenaquinone methyltransferase/2-methoxy-6-polyprenyl-1,4-benzoquinol methylase UbiE [bacterium]|nr:bifunctional demethylmenaquinone methyltransferase/2-methoxy-6-polyprenyl-1,4-benzoquinol methylase UbiE [bacterium]HPN44953.1 bifunctional demethylmenaquinone methyltransferase/2-methoxy-6-polyprenyl-1,4-benzoquinol methylase UbiE [bacterium]